MLNDIRHAARSLSTNRTFLVVAILTLALGIGVNTAMFTVVNAVLLRPLPYPDAERLVMVWQDLRLRGGPADEWATPGNLADWQNAPGVFGSLAAVVGWSPSLSGRDTEPEQLVGAQVTAGYFDVLGAGMQWGRDFRPEDDVPNAPRVVVISHGLWQRRFGGDPSVVGRTVPLSGDPHLVIGVLPAGFVPAVLDAAEIFRPLRLNLASPARGAVILRVIGRLPEHGDLDTARVRADALARQLETAFPRTNSKARINIVPLNEQIVGGIRTDLLVLLGAVGLVLLIACANVANLLLARGLARHREMAVRAALGASQGRIVRQLLTESILLATVGGALGLLMCAWSVQAVLRLAPSGLPRVEAVTIDMRVFAFAALVSTLTALVFGLAPAWRVAAIRDANALKDGQRTTVGSGNVLRSALVVAEVALAVVLLVGASLLLRSFTRLQAFDLGFDPRDVLAGRVAPSPVKHREPEQLVALYDGVLERVGGIAGVRLAALTSVVPFTGDTDISFEIEGRPVPEKDVEQPVAWYRAISAGYFDVMGLRLVKGRGFAPVEPAAVVVVNETMARRYWPGADPVGRRLRPGPDAPWFTVVGVVGDMRTRGAIGRPQAEMFVPYRFVPERTMWILLRTRPSERLAERTGGTTGQALARAAPAAPLRQAVRAVDPDLPVAAIQSMEELAAIPLAQPRFLAMLATAFAVIALGLASCGIYGVMAYSVSRRTPEIGVRMAIGARTADILALVVGQGLRLAVAGAALGTVAAFAVSRWLRELLFEVTPADPLALSAALAVLVLVSVLACYVPARRAARVDPLQALRTE